LFIHRFNLDSKGIINTLDYQFIALYKNFALMSVRLNFVNLINI